MNVLHLLKQNLADHRVRVVLPGEKETKRLYLIMLSAKVNLLDDIKDAYPHKVTPSYEDAIVELYGDEPKTYTYGVFVDKDMKMVFAFNRLYADYSYRTEAVLYENLEDLFPNVALSNSEVQDILTQKVDYGLEKDTDGGMLYSLAEKRPLT